MAPPPVLDADGFPLFPALPGGRVVPVTARSLARLVAGIHGSAVLSARTDALAAMVVFLDREPVDGLAVGEGRHVTGADVLDEIAEVPVDRVTLTEVPSELAAVLGCYFLPTAVRGVPAAVVVAEDFVRSLARPGQRACVLVRSADALGLAFVAAGRVVLAYRQDAEEVGGLEQVAPLFAEPATTVWARIGADTGLTVPAAVRAEPAPPGSRPRPMPEHRPEPPPSAEATPPAEPTTTGTPWPGQDAGQELVAAVLDEVRHVLGPHTVRVEGLFLRADPTVAGLRAAATSLRQRRVRLISRATMDLVVERALAALDRRAG